MGGGKKRRRQDKVESSTGKTKNQSNKTDDLSSLIASLAKQASVADTTTMATCKEARIQKRAAKKQRRQERQGIAQKRAQDNGNGTDDRKPTPKLPSSQEGEKPPNSTTSASKKRLRQLATACKESLPKSAKKSYQKPFEGLGMPKKSRKTKRLDDKTVQPRSRDYGGLGLARDTLFLPFQDPSFTRRLEDEFQEHVDGFFGKQRTKAMKKQLDGKMLWRQLQNNQNKLKDQKVDGKKLANMTPDQRVEAMLKAGML